MKVCLDKFKVSSFAEAIKNGHNIVILPIELFLRLARTGCSLEKTLNVMFSSVKFQLPQLYVEQRNSIPTVVDHDGRHRARYLLSQGFTHIPVVFIGDICGVSKLLNEDNTEIVEFNNLKAGGIYQ